MPLLLSGGWPADPAGFLSVVRIRRAELAGALDATVGARPVDLEGLTGLGWVLWVGFVKGFVSLMCKNIETVSNEAGAEGESVGLRF